MNALVPYPLRLPTTSAATSEAIPQLRCTTSPPAKSRHPSLLSSPTAPDPVTNRSINQRNPQYHENDERTEFHPFRKCSGNESRGDDDKHPLKRQKDVMRDSQSFLDRGPYAAAHKIVQTTYKAADVRSEREAYPYTSQMIDAKPIRKKLCIMVERTFWSVSTLRRRWQAPVS